MGRARAARAAPVVHRFGRPDPAGRVVGSGAVARSVGLDPTSEFIKLEIPGNVGYDDLDRARAWFPKELEYYIPDLATGCKQYKALGRLLLPGTTPRSCA